VSPAIDQLQMGLPWFAGFSRKKPEFRAESSITVVNKDQKKRLEVATTFAVSDTISPTPGRLQTTLPVQWKGQ
jgi:hypothetical protein